MSTNIDYARVDVGRWSPSAQAQLEEILQLFSTKICDLEDLDLLKVYPWLKDWVTEIDEAFPGEYEHEGSVYYFSFGCTHPDEMMELLSLISKRHNTKFEQYAEYSDTCVSVKSYEGGSQEVRIHSHANKRVLFKNKEADTYLSVIHFMLDTLSRCLSAKRPCKLNPVLLKDVLDNWLQVDPYETEFREEVIPKMQKLINRKRLPMNLKKVMQGFINKLTKYYHE